MLLSPDLYALALLFDALISMSFFLGLSLFFMKFIDIISSRLGTVIRYLAFPGVVLHEVCHDLFCRLIGVPVLEHRLFIGKHEGVAGGVIVDTEKIQSFTSGFFVAFAPLILLASALYLLFAFWEVLPMHQALAFYFAFCFFIGLSPSKADVQLVISIIRERPGQTFLELGLLSIPLVIGFLYLSYCSVTHTSFSFCVFGGTLFAAGLVAFLLWQVVKPHRN